MNYIVRQIDPILTSSVWRNVGSFIGCSHLFLPVGNFVSLFLQLCKYGCIRIGIYDPRLFGPKEKDYHGASKEQMNPCPDWIQPWSKWSWIINLVPDPSKEKHPYIFSLHPTTLKEPILYYLDYVVAILLLVQPTSPTWRTFLTPSKNPESTRIDNNKIPVNLAICKKQRMKKFCGNVYPFSKKK